MLIIWECTLRASTRDQDVAGFEELDPREEEAGSGMLGIVVCTVKFIGS